MDFYSLDVSTGNIRQSMSQDYLLVPEAERPPVVHFINSVGKMAERLCRAGEERATDWRISLHSL